MGNDSVKAQVEVENSANIISEMPLPRPDHAHMTQMDADIVYYVAGISKSVKKQLLVLLVLLSLGKTLLYKSLLKI